MKKKNYNIKNLYAQKGFDLSDREKQIPKPIWRKKIESTNDQVHFIYFCHIFCFVFVGTFFRRIYFLLSLSTFGAINMISLSFSL